MYGDILVTQGVTQYKGETVLEETILPGETEEGVFTLDKLNPDEPLTVFLAELFSDLDFDMESFIIEIK